MEESFIIISAFIYGLIFGSFYNVVAYRLPQMKIAGVYKNKFKPANFLAFPWSFCPNCKTPIKFYHNIPVLSYLFLRGRGACCGKKINLAYPAVEALTGALAAFCAYYYGWSVELFLSFIFLSFLLIIALIDIKKYLILNILIWPMMLLGLLSSPYFVGWYQSLWGIIIGYALMGGIYWLANAVTHKWLRGGALGFGDVQLMAAIGAWVGGENMFYLLFLANVLCLGHYLLFNCYQHARACLKARRYKKAGRVFLGAFIAAAGAIMFFYPDDVIIAFYTALQF